MTHMDIWIFLLLTTMRSIIWNPLLVCVDAYVGESWMVIVKYLDIYSNIVYLMLALLLLALIFWYFKRYKRR